MTNIIIQKQISTVLTFSVVIYHKREVTIGNPKILILCIIARGLMYRIYQYAQYVCLVDVLYYIFRTISKWNNFHTLH